MLVLSRKEKEKIRIGEDINVVVLKVYGGRVILGVEAPRHISVHRQEVADRVSRAEGSEVTPHAVAGGETSRGHRHPNTATTTTADQSV